MSYIDLPRFSMESGVCMLHMSLFFLERMGDESK